MTSKLTVNTTVMSGDLDSFQANFNRSVLGVTYRRHKRKRKDFWEMKAHNEEFTDKTFEYLFLNLKKEYKEDLQYYDIRVTYDIVWDENGKILKFEKVIVNLYLPYERIIMDSIELINKDEKIDMHFFYSDYDVGSNNIKKALDKLIMEYGKDNFNVNYYNIKNEDYEENAKLFNVELIPFLRIEDTRIDEPTENKIRDTIVRSMGRQILVKKMNKKSLAGKTIINAKIQT